VNLLDRGVGSRHAHAGPIRLLHGDGLSASGRHRGTALGSTPFAPTRARDLAAACSRIRCDGALYEVLDAAGHGRAFCTRCGAAPLAA
jgi:hypothetical protein